MTRAIPQPDIERAARLSTAWTEGAGDALAAGPNPIVTIALYALAVFVGFCLAAAGVPIP